MANISNFNTAGFGVSLFGPQKQTVSAIDPLKTGLDAGVQMASGLSTFAKDPISAGIVGGVSALWGVGKGLIARKKMIGENKDFANQFVLGQQASQDNIGTQLAQRSVNLNRGYLTNSMMARKGAKLIPRKQIIGIPKKEEKSSEDVAKLEEMVKMLLAEVSANKARKKSLSKVPPAETPKEEVPIHRSGGAINVIPKGVLHARKNNIGDKGIPIVTEAEGGEVKKVAEIELNEIIFHKDVTAKIEECAKKYKEDPEDKENLLELGKLIKYEILNNTKDNQGDLLDEKE